MEIVDFEASSRRLQKGDGGFDVKKSRFIIGLSKPMGRCRFRLIVFGGRDKRAVMTPVRKRPDCAELLAPRFLDFRSRPVEAA
jgi:hypothetical protein